MTTKCGSLVRGRRIRLTRTDGCGRPVFGGDSVAVSKGFISVALTANTSDSDEINLVNAAGEKCVYEPAESSLNGYGVEINFCDVDPELYSLATGMPVVEDAMGNVIGFDVDTAVKPDATGFGLELWMGVSGGDACATDASQGNFGYLLLPYLKGGIIGDFTIENNAVTFTITGANTRDGNAWGVGPHADIMTDGTGQVGPMSSPIKPTVHLRLIQTDVMPPSPVCGTRPLLDPALTAFTSIAGVAGTGTNDFEFATTPPATGGTWWDFGDGEWDYVAAPGDSSHTYAAAGTYQVKASQNGTDWTETSVTVAP